MIRLERYAAANPSFGRWVLRVLPANLFSYVSPTPALGERLMVLDI
jgi:hypothetical protein